MAVGPKEVTRAIIRLFRDGKSSAAEVIVQSATSIIDEYLTSGDEDSVFFEPAYRDRFNQDLNAFLKWERLGKGDDSPVFTGLMAIHKRTLGRGTPAPRDLIYRAIQE